MAAESGFVEKWQNGRSLVECNRHTFTLGHTSDVTFRVGKDGETVRAHRYVLITRSHVFEEMLCGPPAEKDDIKISDVEADVFREMLTYLYTDGVTVTTKNATGMLYLAKKYAVRGLESLCLTFLDKSLTPKNACLILEQAHRFDEKDFYDKAYKLVLQNGNICCASESFKYLSRDCFYDVMSSHDLIISPKSAFQAAIVWAEAECGREERELTPQNLRSILGDIVYRIPFTNMGKGFYLSNVVPRGILTDEENLKLMSWFLCPETDPSPFIRGKDFVLFDGHKLLSGAQRAKTRVFGRVDFRCSRNVTLHSICLYGRGGGGGNREFSSYKLGQWSLFDSYINKRVTSFGSSEEMLETHHIRRYHLKTPVAIRAGRDYYIEVEMEGGSPVYVGDHGRGTVTADQCKLSKYFIQSLWGYFDLIYALEFSRIQS